MRISIVVPAYNEAQRIGHTLEAYIDFFREKDVEFVIVPNNCTDQTESIVQKFSSLHPDRVNVHVINGSVGKGRAVIEGFRKASGDLIGFVDADGSTAPGEFMKLILAIGDHDAAIASRWKKGSKIVSPNLWREIVSVGFITYVKALFWMPYIDTQCGAKLFKRKKLSPVLDRLRINDMAFDVELLWKLHRNKCSIIEVPTVWTDHSGGSSTLSSPIKLMRNAWRMFASILKLRFLRTYA